MPSFRQQNARKQTAFRRAVLANGYSPIPSQCKRSYLKGWNTVQATEKLIEKWGRQIAYQATGLRVETGLCAIDVDIDDAEIVARVWERALARFPQLREALVRFGSGAKELWLCRTPEPFSVLYSTSHYRLGDEGETAAAYRLEAFGGGHVRQIGASGAHTMKADGSGFEIEYTWMDDESPAEVALSALPVLSKDAVLAIVEIASEEMANAGWPRVPKSTSGESDSTVVYDLTDDMLFNCLDGVQRTLAQMTGYAETSDNSRCSASWLGDPSPNRTRCLVSLDHDHVLTILETASWSQHKPATEADRGIPVTEKVSLLAEKLKDRGFVFDTEAFYDAPAAFQDVVRKLHDDWAWCGSRALQCLPIHRSEDLAMSVNNLRMTMLQHTYEREGARGGVVKINPVDAWLVSSQRQDVDGYRFMPDKPPGVYSVLGVRAINSYRAPEHVAVTSEQTRDHHLAIWVDFMEHLLPDTQERHWFLDWLAHKRQNPCVPGVAVLMVTPTFGVGRATLFEFVENVFGQDYTRSVSAGILMGSDSQSQYTDWLSNTLIATTDEVLPEGDDGSSMAWRRHRAYERLKERVDTKARKMMIVRKGLPNYQDMVYASFLMATNHVNALPIPKGDRRFVVLTNNLTPLAKMPALIARINSIRNPEMNPKFISALDEWLLARDITGFNMHVAPDFHGKGLMLEANVTELEGVVVDVLDGMPHEWCTLDAVLHRVENVLIRRNIKDSFAHWRRAATDIAKQRWFFIGRFYTDRARARKSSVLLRDPRGLEAFKSLATELRGEQLEDMMNAAVAPSAVTRAARAGIAEVDNA